MGKKKSKDQVFGKDLTIDWETADRITVDNLKQYVKLLTEETDRLESRLATDDIQDYQRQDYIDNLGYLKAIQKVLEYFGEK